MTVTVINYAMNYEFRMKTHFKSIRRERERVIREIETEKVTNLYGMIESERYRGNYVIMLTK